MHGLVTNAAATGYVQSRAGTLGLNAYSVKNFGWVAKHVETSRRRDVLTFGHHEAVAALPAAQQKHWLERAARERLSVHITSSCNYSLGSNHCF